MMSQRAANPHLFSPAGDASVPWGRFCPLPTKQNFSVPEDIVSRGSGSFLACRAKWRAHLSAATIGGPETSVYLVEHVEGQQREAQVVDHHGTSAGVRLPVLHVLGPHPHDQEIEDCQRKGCWVVVQQQPASHPLICTQMENVVGRTFAAVMGSCDGVGRDCL